MTTSTLQIANEIRNQIGSRALFMLGAYNLAGDQNGFYFRIKGSRKVNSIKIKLTADDLYTMTFGRVRGLDYKVTAVHEGVYADMMHQLIEQETGLYTSL